MIIIDNSDNFFKIVGEPYYNIVLRTGHIFNDYRLIMKYLIFYESLYLFSLRKPPSLKVVMY